MLFDNVASTHIPCRIQPVGSQILSGLSIAGNTWNLWSGPNSNWQVFSFVISSGEVRNFNADLNEFFRALLPFPSLARSVAHIFLAEYLIQHQGVASTQVSPFLPQPA